MEMTWNLESISKTTTQANEARAQAAWELLWQRTDLGFFSKDRVRCAIDEVKKNVLPSANGNLHIVGIGGSSLGSETLISLLPKSKKVFFHDNIDAVTFHIRLAQLNSSEIREDSWMLISKSGGTLESLAIYNFYRQYILENFNFDIQKKTYVITEKSKNPLFDWATEQSIPILEVPKDVGGRFSVFTPVGLAPMAWLGEDLNLISQAFDKGISSKSLVINIVAQFLQSFERQESITYFMSYSDRLSCWGKWLMQLWAESLGKKHNRLGELAGPASVPIFFRGATDQHSILQQLVDGNIKKFAMFFEVEESYRSSLVLKHDLFRSEKLVKGMTIGDLLKCEMQGTRESLTKSGVNNITLKTSHLDLGAVCELMIIFELVVGTLGEALNVNAFDQPGVESGKSIAVKLLRQSC